MPENKENKKNDDKNFWGIENGSYTPEYVEHVNKMVNDSTIMKKAISDLAYTNYGVKSPEDFKRLAMDHNPKEVHAYVRKHYESTTPKAKAPDYWGTYVDPIGNLKKITLSEYRRQIALNPKFGSKFEADGEVENSMRELPNEKSHKPQKTTSFYDLPPQEYNAKTDSFYNALKTVKKEDEKTGDVAQAR